MTVRPSQPNAQAEVQEVLQPLLGSAQQTAPSTSWTPQAVVNLEATSNGENSSQDNSTVTNESNSTANLEVFILSVSHLCIGSGLVVIFVGCYISLLCIFLDQVNQF